MSSVYVGRYQAFPSVAGAAFPGVTAAANMGDPYWSLVIVFMDLSHVISVLTAET